VDDPHLGLVGRRLERLRELSRGRALPPSQDAHGHARAPADAPAPVAVPPRPARDPAHAARLAEAVGGTVDPAARGAVVRIETSDPLPASLGPLAALPFPFDPAAPVVCLDTETTGLGTATGMLAFIVGIGMWSGDRFVVRQFLMPDHPDEPALLEAVAAAIPEDAWLVTYNGRTFDWPLLVTRFRLQHLPPPPHAGHLDLLPVARQLWRHRLADARLVSVESGVAGIHRGVDLPGGVIPDRYLTYLRTGRAAPLRHVAEHNRQDVISLARLLVVLAERFAPRDARQHAHPGDLAGLGRAYSRMGDRAEGLACVDLALELLGSFPWYRRLPHLEEALVAERARLLARLGERDEAALSWLAVAHEGGRLAPLGWVQVAKYREHVARDPEHAIEAAARAGSLAARARLTGMPLAWLERDLARRVPRLRRRLARAHITERRPSAA
jgi:uncharacterized protein YprB with RNaseH-like and TPR domain